jgi:hypothetical protein
MISQSDGKESDLLNCNCHLTHVLQWALNKLKTFLDAAMKCAKCSDVVTHFEVPTQVLYSSFHILACLYALNGKGSVNKNHNSSHCDPFKL